MKFTASRKLSIAAAVLLAAGAGAWAQTSSEQQKIVHAQATVAGTAKHLTVVSEGDAAAQGSTFTFVASEMDFETKVVKGMPFSADTMTEFTQMLSNGQRIYRKTTGAMYRDSEGRTRKEQTIGAIGSYASAEPALQTITINDPVAGLIYMMNPESHTATKNATVGSTFIMHVSGPEGAGVAGGIVQGKTGAVVATGAGGGGGRGGRGVVMTRKTEAHATTNSRTEPLGLKMIEGIQAEGTRTVETIPAGTIGNDSPIEIVSEKWYSPELGIVVRTSHSDPRSGENVYQLTNIRRGDPPADLFQVPGEYTIKEGPGQMKTITIKKKDGNK